MRRCISAKTGLNVEDVLEADRSQDSRSGGGSGGASAGADL